MNELYNRLGIEKSASQAELKSAYRALAKKLHPDHNLNDDRVAEKFKTVSAAYDILRNKDKRSQYDRGEIDENGNPKAPAGFGGGGFGQGFGGNRSRHTSARPGGFGFDDAEDMFSEFFSFNGRTGNNGNAQNPYKTAGRDKGLDINYQIIVGFEESITGGTRRLRLNDGRNVDIKVPAGIQDGQVIRLAKQGGPGIGGAPKGDALVEVQVAKHPYYRRKGNDILLDLPISLSEAVLGGDILVPTPSGKLTVRIPRNSSSGKRLRLKDKGVKRKNTTGHMYVTLILSLPEEPDENLEKLIKEWDDNGGEQLRKKAGLS
ncbi:MAG: DnaJ domain-containing protein [Kordiimonadaceae bacterium]|nr:DnaJ domain-containing protein [Kordiimonadaceae bacterium]